MPCRFFFIFMLVFLSTLIAFSQSCIVYKKEKDGIFIGADTRMLSYATNETIRVTESVYSSICKIGNVDKICFAITGYSADIALSEARNIFQDTILFTDAIKKYTKSFGQKLADILEAHRIKMHDFFKEQFPSGKTVGGSVFFYYENGILIGNVVRMILVSQPFEKATIATRNENIDSIGTAGSSIGIRVIIFNNDVWKKGAVKGITNLIGIERMANPTEVGGDADILFVSTKNEISWVQQNKCQ